MKTQLFKIAFVALCTLNLNLIGQTNVVPYYNWSNPTTFSTSSSPLIYGYGELSDSLSKEYNCRMVFAYNEDYYLINSWADYYLWYTKKYHHQFDSPQLYEYYYLTNDDLEMSRFVAQNFIGYYYPSKIVISFPGKEIEQNYLATNQFIPDNDKTIKKLERSISNKQVRTTTKSTAPSNPNQIKEIKHRASSHGSASYSRMGNKSSQTTLIKNPRSTTSMPAMTTAKSGSSKSQSSVKSAK